MIYTCTGCEPHVCGIVAWFTPRFFLCMLHRKLNRFETGLPHARFCFEIRCL